MNSFDFINEIYKQTRKKLYFTYLISPQDYNRILITKIIFQDEFKLLSQYKEMLLYTDPKEFLKRFYQLVECKTKIKRYCIFYEENSKIFPNYVPLPEAKYIFKNIKKKQKMLDNLNEDDNDNKKDNSNNKIKDIVFSPSIINSIMLESSSNTIKTDKSLLKIIDNICLNENESFLKDYESISSNKDFSNEFINSNNIKIDYSYKISPSRKNNLNVDEKYNKLLKDYKTEGKINNKVKKKINENQNKKNSKDKIKQKLNIKKNNQQVNHNINKIMKKLNFGNVVKDINLIKMTNKLVKEKSKSKSKELLTERIHKTKNNSIKSIINESKKLKSGIENYSSKQKSFSIQTKQESQSAPKTQHKNNINQINKKYSPNKQNLSGQKNKNKCPQNFYNIKSSLKFSNIKLQKPINQNMIHFSNNYNPLVNNNYTLLLKHIPSLHISINNNVKSNSTLSKSKSKSHSKSKSPSNGSLNKNIKQNTIKNFKKNIQNLNNNLKALIQKDNLFNNVDILQTERINKSGTSQIKVNSKKKLNSQGNLNNNILKRNIHKKIISSATSSEYTKLIPKIGKDSLTNSFGVNKGKLIKNHYNINQKLNENHSNKKIHSSSVNKSNILVRSINSINLNNTLQKINNPLINSRTGSNSSNRKSNKQISSNTNSSNIVKRAVKKIKNFEKNKAKKPSQTKVSKSVLTNILKNNVN